MPDVPAGDPGQSAGTTPQPPPQGQPAEVRAAPPPPTNGGTTPPTGTKPEVDGVTETDQGYLVRSDAFKRLKANAREKGRSEALETYAQEQGFASAAEMQAALQKARPGSAKPRRRRRRRRQSVADLIPGGDDVPKNDTPTGGDGASATPQTSPNLSELRKLITRLERKLDAAESEKADLAKRARKEAAARKRLRQEKDALHAEMLIRVAAARTGIKDVDYAMRLLTQHLDGKGDEELESFNEDKFFTGLREKHPYLFDVTATPKPATTGNPAGTAPPTPTPGAAGQSAAQGSQTDAKKMNPQEFQDHLRKRGLNITM